MYVGFLQHAANSTEKLKKFAASDLSILIQGESGTGKELLAELIHANSAVSHKEMQKVNCASFPESLLDNELFGHEKGAFTGATLPTKGFLNAPTIIRYS
jgi:transcriptional regulator with GAF, ATPase, and Fis domain